MKKEAIVVPEGCREVLLHACCAPCSSAIVEWLVQHDVRPVIFYYNPNIFPREEYEIRKQESKRHAETLGITWIDGDYDHDQWLDFVRGCGNTEERGYDVANEPERGRRCESCFMLRLTVAAQKAKELGIRYFATTLASSRWKSLEQIEHAGRQAEQTVNGIARKGCSCVPSVANGKAERLSCDSVVFWAQNWRKGGLYERRNQLLKEFDFYNQQYCGCEFSQRLPKETTV